MFITELGTHIYFVYKWIKILVHLYFVYQLSWQVLYFFFSAQFNNNSNKKNCSTRPNPTHVGWAGLDLCDELGWGWIFFDPPWWVRSKKSLQPDLCTLLSGSHIFDLFTKMPLNNIVCILKTDMRSFLKSVFKYHILNNITQALLKKKLSTKHVFLFFWTTVFSVWTLKTVV